MIYKLKEVRELVVWKSKRRIIGRGHSICKHPKVRTSLVCSRNRKEGMYLEWNEQKREEKEHPKLSRPFHRVQRRMPFYFAGVCHTSIKYSRKKV